MISLFSTLFLKKKERRRETIDCIPFSYDSCSMAIVLTVRLASKLAVDSTKPPKKMQTNFTKFVCLCFTLCAFVFMCLCVYKFTKSTVLSAGLVLYGRCRARL